MVTVTLSKHRKPESRGVIHFTSRIRDEVFRFERFPVSFFGCSGVDYKGTQLSYRRPNKLRLRSGGPIGPSRSRTVFH